MQLGHIVMIFSYFLHFSFNDIITTPFQCCYHIVITSPLHCYRITFALLSYHHRIVITLLWHHSNTVLTLSSHCHCTTMTSLWYHSYIISSTLPMTLLWHHQCTSSIYTARYLLVFLSLVLLQYTYLSSSQKPSLLILDLLHREGYSSSLVFTSSLDYCKVLLPSV